MPRYDYECPQCGKAVEEFRTIKRRHEGPGCDDCHRMMSLTISPPVVHVFKPMWAENLDAEPIWIESKKQYKEEARKRGKIVVDLL